MKKIIWVDDNIKLISDMREMFSDHGFLVDSCTNLTEAYQKLKQGHTNNILVDVEFHNSNKEGITFLENIVDEFPEINAVIYTGYPETDDVVKIIKNKLAADYIRKGSLLTKSKRDLFFKRLHQTFKENNYNKKNKSNRFSTIREFENYHLKIWRLKTIFLILLSLIVLGSIIFYIYINNGKTIQSLFDYFKENNKLTWFFGFVFGLIEFFLLTNLRSKFQNNSNINNYIKRNITPKIPRYLK